MIRYYKTKKDLFVLVCQPDLQITPAPGQPLTAQNVTRALVELSLAQSTRLFDVTAVGRPEATELLRDQMETMLVWPLMDAFGLAPAGRVHIEAIAALVVGAGFLRHRMEAPGLRPLDPASSPNCSPQPSSTPRHRSATGLGRGVNFFFFFYIFFSYYINQSLLFR